jgi:nucleotide-binding universal stress UspA family protein
MNAPTPFVDSIFHASDFRIDSEQAFAHALAIALIRQADFTILHAGRQSLGEDEWTKFPAVRSTLEKWGLLEEGSPRSAIFDELAVRVKKVAVRGLDPLSAIVAYLDEHPPDLIVLGTAGREGMPRWLKPSAGERIARRTDSLSLFVPSGARGFVAPTTGELTLRRILVPIDHEPRPDAAIAYASRAAAALGDGSVEVLLLHVGSGGAPDVDLPDDSSCTWKQILRSGDVVDVISDVAQEHDVDLIAMTTAGHDGFLDVLRGSVTEQVLRRAKRPLLAVPSD